MVHDSPLWSSSRGILTWASEPADGTTSYDTPVTLLLGRSYGMTPLTPDGSERLYTKYHNGDTKIYYWNRTQPTSASNPREIYNFLRGTAYRVEHGADGSVYVMLYENQTAAGADDATWAAFGDANFRVVRMHFDAVNKTLTPNLLMVDTFNNTAPSF